VEEEQSLKESSEEPKKSEEVEKPLTAKITYEEFIELMKFRLVWLALRY